MLELTPTSDAHKILLAVGNYLNSIGNDSEDLIFSGKSWISARSKIYTLVSYRGEPRYVVKIPAPQLSSIDSGPPMTAGDQFNSLRRACSLYANEDAHAVVRPVALLDELGALVIQYVPGATVSKTLQRAIFQPSRAHRAAVAAGDALRRLHKRAQRSVGETALSGLVEDVLAVEASVLRTAGLRFPSEVRRVLDRVPMCSVPTRRVLLHGDYVGLNLILTQDDQVTMIDPVLTSEGLPEDDVARFLTVLSTAPVFLPGMVFGLVRNLRRDLEQAFLAGYQDADQSVVLELRLLRQHALRWRRRRELSRFVGHPRLMRARGRVIDHYMRGLLRESGERLSRALMETGGVRAATHI